MSSLSLNWRTHTTNETTLASGQKVKQKKLSYARRKVCWFWWIPVSKPCRVGKPPHGSHPPRRRDPSADLRMILRHNLFLQNVYPPQKPGRHIIASQSWEKRHLPQKT